MSRTFTFYLAAPRVLFAHLHLPCFSAEAYSKPLVHLRWSVSAYPVKDFKPLTIYAKTLHRRHLKGFWDFACIQIAPNNVLCHHNTNALNLKISMLVIRQLKI